ncbi:response regulator [Pedosphaera parvula]|uniref:Response regulator receiver protein n=1 Tax=Pedosphaera parvula (strain Ellin514) TaxID=320771 RepID=B9XLI9_PEDPL|nr:response regulator [Pedosphaera parvula]EEF59237.1 response regulator receiver protein [Pedosphaera parvula Ellin514]
MKILYVENHSIFAQQVINLFLSEHKVTVRPSLAQARQELTEESYDLLLIDYDLDDGKGTELVIELREKASALFIIAGSSHEAGNQALLKAGANAACSKMEFNKIAEVIRRVQALN